MLNGMREWQFAGPVTLLCRRPGPADGSSEEVVVSDIDLDDLETGLRRWLGTPRSDHPSYLAGWEMAQEYQRASERAGETVPVSDMIEWSVEDEAARASALGQRCDPDRVADGARDWILAYTGRRE